MKILSLFLFLLLNGVFGDESVFVMTGDSVTLHTHVDRYNDYHLLRWHFNGARIAQMNPYAGVQIFRERIQLNDQTGDLTITNMRTTDAGLYELNILSGYGINTRIFTVTVSDGVSRAETNEMKTIQDGVKTIKVKTGNSVKLDTGVTEVQTCGLIQWKMVELGNSSDPFILLARMNKTNNKEPSNGGVRTYRARLQLDHQTGDLIITNTRTTDTGVYKLEITDSRNKISKAFIVTVSENRDDESEDINLHLMRDA
ncbi:uncharacterized protein LOC127439220 [Myxocyprinus asiaticus]|uniref:uncharacterized protein LOC127439220 n=1 Tax=Myxocyprinus asiaticus TaxID=70543 RepID=UPI002222ED8E|nr:uncharacterized protein LOC127439220 [Myxocyprinus asiaticus]